MIWVYVQSEPQLWTVGFYAPDGKWHTDSDHSTSEDAANWVAWLNGGSVVKEPTENPKTTGYCSECGKPMTGAEGAA